jgi:hypothetical protein
MILKQFLNKVKQFLLHQLKEPTVENNTPFVYSEDQLMARLKFFIGICLSLTLFGIVFVVLYSLIFVTQPLNAISPIDQKFFELIVPIATFLTGTLSGIMLAGTSKEDKEAMLQAQKNAQANTEAAAKTTIEQAKVLNPTPPPAPVYQQPVFVPPTGAFAGFTPQVVMSSTGKPMPVQPPQEEI